MTATGWSEDNVKKKKKKKACHCLAQHMKLTASNYAQADMNEINLSPGELLS